MQDTKEPEFEGWAVVEVMGHRRLGGRARETSIAGAPMLRVDVPKGATEADGYVTQFYSGTSIFCLTPTGETEARAVGRTYLRSNAPVHVYEVEETMRRAALPAPAVPSGGDEEPDEDDWRTF